MRSRSVLVPALLLACLPLALPAQGTASDLRSHDSVTVAVGKHYQAGGFHRFLLGGTYRDLWSQPVRIPVLDLQHAEGGLKPEKAGGGKQTKSLQFSNPDGDEFVFRSFDKDHVEVPGGLADVGVARRTAQDQISNSHPAANLVVPQLLQAVGVHHDTPVLVQMPDDPALGKFRKEFAHRVGGFARVPGKHEGGAEGFAGPVDVIDSDTLLQRLDRDPATQVDVTAFLAARLVDMLVNNWDRHPGQWKWARAKDATAAPWEPISRDYDKAFISVRGLLPSISRKMSANLMVFDSGYPSFAGLTWNSLQFDRRMLAGLDKRTWDSVAQATTRQLSDAAIDEAIAKMPPEYHASVPALRGRLRARRDSLPAQADRFYAYLSGVVDIHATDAADRAIVTREDDRHVDVELTDADGHSYFHRRFDAAETKQLRLYLHGGDDAAVVRGSAKASIPLRIIGGNGTNRLVDSSSVGGDRHPTQLYDVGATKGVAYGPDTLFNRRPLVSQAGGPVAPHKDYGGKSGPTAGLGLNHDFGVAPRLGFAHTSYGFRDEPYSSRFMIEGRYSFKAKGYAVALNHDKRFESSALHVTTLARMSDLEMLNYHGLGNFSPQSEGLVVGRSAPRTDFYSVNQRQWLLQPALALELSKSTTMSFGPVAQYSVTDSTPGRFVSASLPYGAGKFGEAGVRWSLYHDNRVPKRHAKVGTILDMSASYFPAVWDVEHPFGNVTALVAGYITLPVPLHPYLGLRVGGKKVFGDFPFQESAFIGGRNDVRTLDLQRYAGDASFYGTAEIRIPLFTLNFLLPVNTGLLGTADAGRVFVKGDSPFGWHNALGAGFWVGFHDLTLDVRVMRANDAGHTGIITLRFVPAGMFP
ncbi:MAG: hypothetical protein ABIZ70_03290 [Gemmatimonadales bacterium]